MYLQANPVTRRIYLALGFFFLGAGLVGVVVPQADIGLVRADGNATGTWIDFPHMGIGLDEIYYPDNLTSEYVRQVWTETYPSGVFEDTPILEVLRRNPPTYYEHNLECLIALTRRFEAKVVMATVTWSPDWDIENRPVGAVCINVDYSEHLQVRDLLEKLTGFVWNYAYCRK